MNTKQLIRDLKLCTSEEAVKASYIKHAGFPAYIKDKVDLMIGRVLFEFKFRIPDINNRYHTALAQALVYYRRIVTGVINLPVPEVLCVVDRTGAVMIEIDRDLKDAAVMDFDWSKPASSPDKKLVKHLEQLTHKTLFFNTEDETSLREFIDKVVAVSDSGSSGVRVISATNFEEVFEAWKNAFGDCFPDGTETGSYFISDLLESSVFDKTRGRLFFPDLANLCIEVPSGIYNEFWNGFGRPPAAEVQQVILSKAHMFMPDSSRRFTGAYYTPPAVAELAYRYLDTALGEGWQKRYYVWDPCAGTGNLELSHRETDRLFLSTLSMTDVLLVKNQNLFPGAEIFQYDFLNGDYYDLPEKLRTVIETEPHNLVILMNPPYAEHGKGASMGANKEGVALTRTGEQMLDDVGGLAARELYMQFIYKVYKLAPKAVIGLFSKLKYITSPGSEDFRTAVLEKYAYRRGFILPGTLFPGVKGMFPISFIIWTERQNNSSDKVYLDVFDKTLTDIGTKMYPTRIYYLNEWFKRPACKGKVLPPLTGALSIFEGKAIYKTELPTDAIGSVVLHANDLQNTNLTKLTSSVCPNASTVAITPETFEFCMLSAAVRKLITPTWLNDRDQFMVPECDRPTGQKLPKGVRMINTPDTDPDEKTLPTVKTNLDPEFITDCVVWILFNGCNNSSAFTAEYKGQSCTIQNEFYPYTPDEAAPWQPGAGSLNQIRNAEKSRVSDWLSKRTLSPEASAVLAVGRTLYKRFYRELPNLHKKKWKLETWNPGWYQIRMSMKERFGNDFPELEQLKKVYKVLGDKLRPQVYSLGFLPSEMVQGDNQVEEDI